MRQILKFFCISWFAGHLLVSLHAQSQNIQQVGEIQFSLPAGLSVERAASESLVHWPVVADWDSEGRLVLVESGGVSKPIQEHNKQLLHRVVRLVDENHDGQFDRRIVAADQLPFPEGVLCLGVDLLVSAPPNIWKLTDADGDGVCERREIWFDGQTITGCANDLHGPYLGRDGWVYWCKGAFAEQTHLLRSGQTAIDSAAHIYRRKIEGGPIEAVMSGGMDNPVETAFTPEGERFFTSTFLQHPGDGLRDGIAHAVYGGVYGKQHGPIDGLVRTGPLMPIMTQLGPAAPSGLTCLEKDVLLPTSSGESGSVRWLTAALFNLQKVTAHRLVSHGATYQTDNIDLLVGNRIDFHPTDILEDADGSLLVVDTGGWYDLCCPTSRVDQQTAAGGIYRLRGQTQLAHPVLPAVDWQTATLPDCVTYLTDSRPWVARMAQLKLSQAGDAAVSQLSQRLGDNSLEVDLRLRYLWALTSTGTHAALAAIESVLSSGQPQLVQAACHAIALHRYQPAKRKLEEFLVAGPTEAHRLPVIRAASEALGRIGDAHSVDVLMGLTQSPQIDAVWLHSCIFALIEINDSDAVAHFLTSASASDRRIALLVLDRLHDAQHLSQDVLLASLVSQDAQERTVAVDILGRHLEWLEAALPALNTFPHQEYMSLFSIWKDEAKLHELVAHWLDARNEAAHWKPTIEHLFAERTGQPPPACCIQPLCEWFESEPQVAAVLLTHMDLTPEYCQPLVQWVRDRIERAEKLEKQLLLVRCLPANHSLANPKLTDQAVQWFVAAEGGQRRIAAEALQRVSLTDDQALEIVDALERLDSRDLPSAIDSVSSVQSDSIDTRLLERLVQLPAARGLPVGLLENIYRHRSSELQRKIEATVQNLLAPSEDVGRQLTEVLAQLPSGNAVRGLEIFRSTKAACSGCHQMGYVGSKIGPELTRIGQTRTRQSLLESILFPSSRIEQTYQMLKVLTVDGQIYQGLVTGQTEATLQLQLTVEKSVTIQVKDIERQEPGSISIMPTGMVELLGKQEIADLLALLEAAR